MHAKRSSPTRWPAAALTAIVVCTPALALACEACRDAVANDPVGTALSATTLLLIGGPALLMGSIGGWVGYVHWRAGRYAMAPDEGGGPPTEAASQPV